MANFILKQNEEVAKAIAQSLGWEWNNPFLEKGTNEVPSRQEFLAAARAAITVIKKQSPEAES